MKRVSLVIPCFNEEAVLPALHERISAVLAGMTGYEFEVILVDDASTDRTPEILAELVRRDPRVRTIRFPRNFGSHTAIRAGLDRCTGDAACILAADLQDPPELIPRLLARLEEGYQVVWAYREGRRDPRSKIWTSAAFHFLMRRVADPTAFPRGADVVAIDRTIIDHLRRDLREKDSNLFTLIRWLGYRQCGFGYVKEARHAGQSHFGLAKRVKAGIDSLVAFSFLPIRLISLAGILVALLGFLYGAFVVIWRIFGGRLLPGYAATMTAILVLSGLQMILLGVVAEYLWRTFNAARDRPLYLIESTRGFDEPGREGNAGAARVPSDPAGGRP